LPRTSKSSTAGHAVVTSDSGRMAWSILDSLPTWRSILVSRRFNIDEIQRRPIEVAMFSSFGRCSNNPNAAFSRCVLMPIALIYDHCILIASFATLCRIGIYDHVRRGSGAFLRSPVFRDAPNFTISLPYTVFIRVLAFCFSNSGVSLASETLHICHESS
jgi:hypothetical protein